METCKARRYNDQMMCGKCGRQWDVDGDLTPPCKLVTVSLDVALMGSNETLTTTAPTIGVVYQRPEKANRVMSELKALFN